MSDSATAARISLQDLTSKIGDLPALPTIVVRLLQASRDASVSMREMVELIKLDPALTAKVLRGDQRSAAAAEGVEDDVVLVAAEIEDAFE